MKHFLLAVGLLTGSTLFAQKTGSLTLQFHNKVGNEEVVLKDKQYTNAVGEQFNITFLQYYVSNLRLLRKDGSEYIVPQDDSYFLIRQQLPETQSVTLHHIPKGDYVGLSFVIGVDSLRSASDVSKRKGCLDVGGDGKEMYWAWNSGYIFVKMEGTSPQIPLTGNRKEPIFLYHIGLFGGMGEKKTLNNIKVANLSFGKEKVKIKTDKNTAIGIKTDVSQLFTGSVNVSLAVNPTVMAGPYSAKIADNYAGMFSYEGLQKSAPAPSEKITLGMK
ncbi:MAG: MbnP family protein [Spirosomataceae bacterium]